VFVGDVDATALAREVLGSRVVLRDEGLVDALPELVLLLVRELAFSKPAAKAIT
jgi:hypothetical protein